MGRESILTKEERIKYKVDTKAKYRKMLDTWRTLKIKCNEKYAYYKGAILSDEWLDFKNFISDISILDNYDTFLNTDDTIRLVIIDNSKVVNIDNVSFDVKLEATKFYYQMSDEEYKWAMKVVTNEAKKYVHLGLYDEVYSIGNYAVGKACIYFDESKDILFKTFVKPVIIHEIGMYFRKPSNKTHETNVSIDKAINEVDGNTYTYADILEDSSNNMDTIFDNMVLSEAINKLDNRLQKVVLLRYNGYKQKDLSNILNVSQSQVSRLEKRAYKLLRKELS